MAWYFQKKKAKETRNRQDAHARAAGEAQYGKAGSVMQNFKGVRGFVIGKQKTRGGVYSDPRFLISQRIKSALHGPSMSYVTVKDAKGNVTHYLDPITRKKVSIQEMEIIKIRGIDPAKMTEVK